MTESVKDDVNRGYIKFIKTLSLKPNANSNGIIKSTFVILKRLMLTIIKLVFIPILFLYGLLLTVFLRIRLLFVINKQSELHLNAIKYIPEFISQYPMHLYPVVAKSIEMAFIKGNIEKVRNKIKDGVVELAIGDGTLSNRIFSKGDTITAFDLNPYSLAYVRNCEHVSKRIVADCLNPPISKDGASFIVCNNLLHHITNKEYTLSNWAQIAPYALFNENTNYWASSWMKPYLLRLIGLNSVAEKTAKKIEHQSLQSLWKYSELKSIVEKYYEEIEEKSFLSERVFFLCAVCSSLLFCYGPPTPNMQKKILNKLLWPITKILTYNMAKLLIEYDAILPRDKDSFVCWVVKSKKVSDKLPGKVTLICPDCHEPIQDNKCNTCKTTFEENDGMLFLLSKELRKEITYSISTGSILGEEHL